MTEITLFIFLFICLFIYLFFIFFIFLFGGGVRYSKEYYNLGGGGLPVVLELI